MTLHRWVIHERVPDYLLIGWLALPSLDRTHHGQWSVHCVGLDQVAAFASSQNRSRESNRLIDALEVLYGLPARTPQATETLP